MTSENSFPAQDNPQSRQHQAVERLLHAYNQEELNAWDLSYSELQHEDYTRATLFDNDQPAATQKKPGAKTPFHTLFRKYDPYLFLECCYTLENFIGNASNAASCLTVESFENGEFAANVGRLSVSNINNEELKETVERSRSVRAVGANGRTIAVRDNERISIWDLETEALISDIPFSVVYSHLDFDKHIDRLLARFLLSPDGKTLIVLGEKYIMFWAIAETCELKATFPSPCPFTEAFSPDGETLAIKMYDGLYLWNVNTGSLKKKVKQKEYATKLTALAFSPDGQTLASGGWVSPRYTESVRFSFQDAQTLGVKAHIRGITRSLYHSNIEALAVSPNGQTLAFMKGGKIFFRDAFTDRTPLDESKCFVFQDNYMQGRRSVIEAHSYELRPGYSTTFRPSSLAFSADGQFVVSCYCDIVKVWSVKKPGKFLVSPDQLFQCYLDLCDLNLRPEKLSSARRAAFLSENLAFPHWQAWEASYLVKQKYSEPKGSAIQKSGKHPFYWLAYLLKTRQWQLADQETEAVMLKFAGIPDQPYLSPENIDALPLHVLRIIDRLWMMRSDGRYGFSAQAQVWGRTIRQEGEWSQINSRDVSVDDEFKIRLGWERIDFDPNCYSDNDEYQTSAYDEYSVGYYPRKINSNTLLALHIIDRLDPHNMVSGSMPND